MGRIFPFLTYWPALKPRGGWRSEREEGAEEPDRHHSPSTCLGAREAEAEGRGHHHLPAGTVADSMKATVLRLGKEVGVRGRRRPRSTYLGTREEEVVEPAPHHQRAATLQNYPEVPDCVARDSSKAETGQRPVLTN